MKLTIWLRDPLPVRVLIKGIPFEIRADSIAGGPGTMNLEAARLDTGRTLILQELPASAFQEGYFAHAWFESLPGTRARKLANILLAQGLAVDQPEPSWVYRYEHAAWADIKLGGDYHHGGWHKKTSPSEPAINAQHHYLIRTIDEP